MSQLNLPRRLLHVGGPTVAVSVAQSLDESVWRLRLIVCPVGSIRKVTHQAAAATRPVAGRSISAARA